MNAEKKYNAGIYLRLSREDEGAEPQSESIGNQRDFLSRYAAENGFAAVEFYTEACDIIEPTQKTSLNQITL